MSTVLPADIDRMTDAVYIDGPLRGRKSSKFWILLILAAVIATAGIEQDSTATVIGAMIVAPLMTPILGTALAIVLANRSFVVRSALLVIGGALVVVAIGFLIGSVAAPYDDFVSNGQVAARIHPKLIDLTAALATGMVGAFALVRSDISDTLPGVAIAISLVPPLAVVGLLLSVHRYADAGGAALLFSTNVAAIIATGAVVLLAYRVRDAARLGDYDVGDLRGRSLLAVALMVVIVSIPLAFGSLAVVRDQQLTAKATPLAESWAANNKWVVTTVVGQDGEVVVTALGSPPDADPAALRQAMNDNGLADAGLLVRLVLGGVATCPSGGDTCVSSDDAATG